MAISATTDCVLAPMRPKFEYHILRTNNLPILGNSHEIEKKLNALGKQGWELIGVEWSQPVSLNLILVTTTKLHKEHIFYFKRRLK